MVDLPDSDGVGIWLRKEARWLDCQMVEGVSVINEQASSHITI